MEAIDAVRKRGSRRLGWKRRSRGPHFLEADFWPGTTSGCVRNPGTMMSQSKVFVGRGGPSLLLSADFSSISTSVTCVVFPCSVPYPPSYFLISRWSKVLDGSFPHKDEQMCEKQNEAVGVSKPTGEVRSTTIQYSHVG